MTSLTLVAVGDMSFNGRYHRFFERYGVEHSLRLVLPQWQHANLRFGNLESPITDQPRVAPDKLTLRGSPFAIDAIQFASFDCVTIANNHMMDFGATGLLQTMERLDSAGISHVGAGRNLNEATSPEIFEQNGQRVGVLACCDVEQDSPLYASNTDVGVAPYSEDRWFQDIRNLRDHVDWLVVQMHWGFELSQIPAIAQRSLARRMAESGVDVVLGHHPHVLQPVERIGNTFVAYSLGDFLFSSTYWYGKNSREVFLACYHSHPLSRKTGWLEVRLERDHEPTAVVHPALLMKNLCVRPDELPSRQQRMSSMEKQLQSADYETAVILEQAEAAERDLWRFDAKRMSRRVALRLLKYRCLRDAYVEPAGHDWRDQFNKMQRTLS